MDVPLPFTFTYKHGKHNAHQSAAECVDTSFYQFFELSVAAHSSKYALNAADKCSM
jgi:hypothetical protein